ncbi:DUF6115 domain-containing protein [Candidatus Contubernalis alkaliaceticus]|uniref:DUF6115 domain-containing protein n=1 Tax=Candidatus Contubernalis alkaliaceticus TaxID=338645 RepID=UPI001F4BFE5A|nr:hypothetical protein [Candidatus Contubernalis alkalaceticus]UNC91766.1 hypothetical protein HUE98_06470 [Candidatus Contubernalis alkalaceticus]
MVYIILFFGLAIIIYSLFHLAKDHSTNKENKPMSAPVSSEEKFMSQEDKVVQLAFQDYISGSEEAVEGKLLYELKEKVEVQLSELAIQRELVSHMMMRVEKKLDSQPVEERVEVKKAEKRAQGKLEKQKNEVISLNEDALDRARLHNDVYLLYDQKIPLAEIAKQVGLGKGEVELILGLRK